MFTYSELKVTKSLITRLGPKAWLSILWGLNQERSDSESQDLTHWDTRPLDHWNIRPLDHYATRVLATVKNSVVNKVFPIWLTIELPNLYFPNTSKCRNSEIKSEKSNKNKHKSNINLKQNKKKKDIKKDMMSVI